MDRAGYQEAPPNGLAQIIDEHAPRESLTIVANRLPVTRADHQWELSPGGLVRALLPVMRASHAAWIGWSGETGSAHAGPIEYEDLRLIGVPLSESEHDQYYRHVSNEMLWPLFHDGVRHPVYDSDAWAGYQRVNQRFAEAAASQTPSGGMVWIHDYHLLLVPGMLRALRPDVSIGIFIHIPVPPVELFATLPWRDEIVRSMRASDLIGLQTEPDAEHMRQFINSPQFGGDDSGEGAPFVHIEAFPISIESKRYRDKALRFEKDGSVREIRKKLAGSRKTMMLGVDRLDYTKGIDKRLEALLDALEKDRLDATDICFVQVAVPSRESVAKYAEISSRIDALVGLINGLYGGMNGPVVQYIKESLDEDELVRLYRAADIMVVTPLRDGMNLVAKEFLATRYDGTGDLILSEFAGAAHEFHEAMIVNPHDVSAITEAMVEARHSGVTGASKQAMMDMHERVCVHDVHRWSERFLDYLRRMSVRDAGDSGSVAEEQIRLSTTG